MQQEHATCRREFIKSVTFLTAYSALMGKAWTDTLGAEIQPLSAAAPGVLRLRLQDFPALQQPSGSVRLAINPISGNPPNGPMPNGSFYPIVINRGADNVFHTLNSRCKHQNCVVDALNPANNQMRCRCHTSIYGIDGRRLSGESTQPLDKFTHEFDGQDSLSIQIPNLGFSLTVASVAGGETPRLQLTFAAQRNVPYEVLFRETVEAAPAAVMFSTTETGPLSQSTFTTTSNGSRSVFVGRTSATGFYTVAVKVTRI